MTSILILLHLESVHSCIRIQAQSFLLGMDLLGKGPSCLNITVMC
jgi:hypothetical protein